MYNIYIYDICIHNEYAIMNTGKMSNTLRETNISHLAKEKRIFKCDKPFAYVLFPGESKTLGEETCLKNLRSRFVCLYDGMLVLLVTVTTKYYYMFSRKSYRPSIQIRFTVTGRGGFPMN